MLLPGFHPGTAGLMEKLYLKELGINAVETDAYL